MVGLRGEIVGVTMRALRGKGDCGDTHRGRYEGNTETSLVGLRRECRGRCQMGIDIGGETKL